MRAILLRDTGATVSPFNAFLFLQGLETLSLRVERHSYNALKVVEYLNNHPQVESVSHPSVSTDPKQNRAHIVRAAQEGIVFSFCYGMEIMQQMGMDIKKIHAGKANMFLSPLFRDTLAGVSGATIELYETDGSAGAAKGAGIGAGIYKDHDEAFATLKKLAVIEPDEANRSAYLEAYAQWKKELKSVVKE